MTKPITAEALEEMIELIDRERKIAEKLQAGFKTLSNEEHKNLTLELTETHEKLSRLYSEYFERIS